MDRPALCEALGYARSGDTLIVWKLDRLARSMKQLIETIEGLRLRGIGFRSLTEAIDTTTPQGVLVFPAVQAAPTTEHANVSDRPICRSLRRNIRAPRGRNVAIERRG